MTYITSIPMCAYSRCRFWLFGTLLAGFPAYTVAKTLRAQPPLHDVMRVGFKCPYEAQSIVSASLSAGGWEVPRGIFSTSSSNSDSNSWMMTVLNERSIPSVSQMLSRAIMSRIAGRVNSLKACRNTPFNDNIKVIFESGKQERHRQQ
jgi:hypothetical protein